MEQSPENIGNGKKTNRGQKKSPKQRHISNYAFRWIALTLDFLVFLTVAIYSAFAFLQWRAMRDQINIAQAQIENGKNDQRPWVNTVTARLRDGPEIGKPIIVEIQL